MLSVSPTLYQLRILCQNKFDDKYLSRWSTAEIIPTQRKRLEVYAIGLGDGQLRDLDSEFLLLLLAILYTDKKQFDQYESVQPVAKAVLKLCKELQARIDRQGEDVKLSEKEQEATALLLSILFENCRTHYTMFWLQIFRVASNFRTTQDLPTTMKDSPFNNLFSLYAFAGAIEQMTCLWGTLSLYGKLQALEEILTSYYEPVSGQDGETLLMQEMPTESLALVGKLVASMCEALPLEDDVTRSKIRSFFSKIRFHDGEVFTNFLSYSVGREAPISSLIALTTLRDVNSTEELEDFMQNPDFGLALIFWTRVMCKVGAPDTQGILQTWVREVVKHLDGATRVLMNPTGLLVRTLVMVDVPVISIFEDEGANRELQRVVAYVTRRVTAVLQAEGELSLVVKGMYGNPERKGPEYLNPSEYPETAPDKKSAQKPGPQLSTTSPQSSIIILQTTDGRKLGVPKQIPGYTIETAEFGFFKLAFSGSSDPQAPRIIPVPFTPSQLERFLRGYVDTCDDIKLAEYFLVPIDQLEKLWSQSIKDGVDRITSNSGVEDTSSSSASSSSKSETTSPSRGPTSPETPISSNKRQKRSHPKESSD